MERWEEKENREYYRAGTIAAAALSPYRNSELHPEPFGPHDFFSLPKPPKPAPDKKQILANADQMLAFINARHLHLEKKERRSA